MTHLDVGGGLGVNYGAGYARDEDGINYGLQEYANAVVFAVKEVCDAREVPTPILVSESGRAITAHHSVLIVPVLGTHRPDNPLDGDLPDKPHQTVKGLKKILDQLRRKNPPPEELLEAYHDAKDARNEADQLFTPRLPAARSAGRGAAAVLDRVRGAAAAPARRGARPGPRRARRARGAADGSLSLRLLRVPVHARPLGHRPGLPDHADRPARGEPEPARRDGGPHLRLRRQGEPLHLGAGRQDASCRCTRCRPTSPTTSASS